MKILLVTNMYPSKKYPHYGVFVKNCENILKQRGYTVDTIAISKTDIKLFKIIKYLLFYIKVIINGAFAKYDFIYGHYASHIAFPILILKKIKKKIKIIINVHGNDVVPETEKDQRYLKMVKKLIEISNLVIVPSNYFKNVLEQDYSCCSSKIVIYPSGGVDGNIFYPMEKKDIKDMRIKMGLNKDEVCIGYVGRIEKDKGWDIFLKASEKIINKYKNIKLIIVGTGEEEEKFQYMGKKLKIQNSIIKFNMLSQREIASIYNVMDLFVFPTYRKSESLGLVGLEAMACGKVTILPDKYGPASYGIDRMNCYQFKSGNELSLERKIEEALDKRLYSDKIVEGAIQTANNYSKKNTEEILVQVFEELK